MPTKIALTHGPPRRSTKRCRPLACDQNAALPFGVPRPVGPS